MDLAKIKRLAALALCVFGLFALTACEADVDVDESVGIVD